MPNKHDGADRNRTCLVDAHCHLWRKELASRTWLTPDLKHLFRTFEQADLSEALETIGARACVLIEAGKTTEENMELQRIGVSSPSIAAVIPYLDLQSPKLAKELDIWQLDPKFRGVRMGFETGDDNSFLRRRDIIEGLQEIARRDLILEFLVQPSQLKDVLTVCEYVPQLRGILEHMGKPDMLNKVDRAEWQRDTQALAKHTNITCKLSLSPRAEQMGLLSAKRGKGWRAETVKPYVDFLVKHFGVDRLVWGSDWPICLLSTNYRDMFGLISDLLSGISGNDRAKVFGGNAIEFYKLNVIEEDMP